MSADIFVGIGFSYIYERNSLMNTRVAMVVAGLAVSASGVVAQDRVESALCRDSVVGEIEIEGGWSCGLFVYDGYMYEVKEDELHVFDVHEIESPVLVQSYNIENIHGVTELVDGYLYSVGNEQILVHDLSDPFDVREVSRYEFPFSGFGVEAIIEGPQVLMVNRDFVRLIDFSDMSNPVEFFVQPTDVGVSPYFLRRSGDLVLYGDFNEIGVYEFDEQQGLVFMGESEFRLIQGYAVFVDGYLVVSDGGSLWDGGASWFNEPMLFIYDMSNPIEPVIAGLVPAVHGSLEYIEDFGLLLVRSLGEIIVWDVTDVLNPEMIGSVANEQWNSSSMVSDGHLIWSSFAFDHVGYEDGLIRVADLSRLGSTVADQVDTPNGHPVQIEIDDGIAYVYEVVRGGSSTSRIQLYDLDDPAHPVPRGTVNGSGVSSWMYIDWPYMYTVGGENGISVLDVSDPDQVMLLGETNGLGSTPGVTRGICAIGDVVYVAYEEGLYLFDVSDPAMPWVIGSLEIAAYSAVAYEGVLYIGTSGGTMGFDISDPRSPLPMGALSEESSHFMVEHDGRVFMPGYYGIQEYEVEAGGELTLMGTHGIGAGYFSGVALQGNQLVIHGETGAYVYELFGDGTSAYLGATGERILEDVALHDEYLYMATERRGLVVHDLSSRCGACLADLNGDGVLNYFDAAALMAGYQAGDMSVDLNGDGSIDFHDVAAFLDSYGAGCP